MCWILSVIVLVYSVSAACGSVVLSDIVEVQQGKVRGVRGLTGQRLYYGIPYAVSDRFQEPRDPPSWSGELLAVDRFTSCAQTVSVLRGGREDCLHLDVYTPDRRARTLLPVLVFIHGGAYYYGSKAHYDPEFLVDKNVVAVVINYRVGVLGFLCVNGIANLGLKDQVAALKWIRRNIAAFGGDPDNVTLCGQSAGASAAAMHLLSPSSAGLFHKVILLSGSPLAPWAFNPEPETPAFQDARKLGTVTSAEDVVRIFSEASLSHLLAATSDTSINTRYFKYSPCVEGNGTSDPFFPDTPYALLRSGRFNKVPIVIGFADVEGMLFYGLHNQRTFKDFDENFPEKLPAVFSWCSESDRLEISDKIRRHYFGSDPISSSRIKETVRYYSDWIAYSHIDAFSELMTEVSNEPVYSYMFAYEGDRNFAKLLFGLRTGLSGASHSDDIFYMFKPAGLSLLLTTPDLLFIDRFTTMITNFMKYGDPTPKSTRLLPERWSRYSNATRRVLRLASTSRMSTLSDAHRGLFYLQLLCEHGQPGYVPCRSAALCEPATQPR